MVEPQIVSIPMRDGIHIAAAIYAPSSGGPFPALLAASPYRFDNNILPESPQFLWRETGPIGFYLDQGYVYVHMDVRGSGRSGGDFGFFDLAEQNDYYDVIEWIARQDWSNGKVGGIGQSYYCMAQWFMGAANPPSLACLGAHDGLTDLYRAICYNGGIPGYFFPGHWWYQNRLINRFPACGPPRDQHTDLEKLISAHPTYDDFWLERSAWERLSHIKTPLYSSGVWGKMFIHTRGNIEGFRRASGPKKLRMSGANNVWEAAAEYSTVDFHERVLLPFYNHYLKGRETDYPSRPKVEYAVRGAEGMRFADEWPPKGVRFTPWYLNGGASGSVNSLNDGGLAPEKNEGAVATHYRYPDPGWVAGVVGWGPGGLKSGYDPVRRVLTFTTPALDSDLEIAGPIKLVLYASSTNSDTDFFVKISDQHPQAGEQRAKGINPHADLVSRGWLRASHRALDRKYSSEMEPYHTHSDPEPLLPNKTYRFDISIEPMAYRFRQGHRIRLEIVNGDSPISEGAYWAHYYRPDQIGEDTIHHGGEFASALILPVLP